MYKEYIRIGTYKEYIRIKFDNYVIFRCRLP